MVKFGFIGIALLLVLQSVFCDEYHQELKREKRFLLGGGTTTTVAPKGIHHQTFVTLKPLTTSDPFVNSYLWTEQDVEAWVKKIQFDSDVKKLLKNFNGKMLYELAQIRSSLAEFWFAHLSKNIDLGPLLKFSIELKNLKFRL